MIQQKHAPVPLNPGAPPTSTYWLACLFVALLGCLQIYFFDVTFHGPDQIRDMEIARRLVHEQVWPLNGPPLFGERFHLPPGFYYLLALPLLVRDSEASIFVTFGALFALSVAYLMHVVHARLGSRHAMAYAALAFPLFACLYTHSAWNPALVMTLSNVVLALFINLVHRRPQAAFWLPIAAFLLVQIHPSAAPLLLGLGCYALVNLRTVLTRASLASLGIVAALTCWWLFSSTAFSKLQLPAEGAQTPGASVDIAWLTHLLDLNKWRDAALMPYSTIDSLQPAIIGLSTLAGFQVGLLWLGLLLGALLANRERSLRWTALVATMWLLVSMAFLRQGAFWHLDVIHPWLAVLGASGWAYASEKIRVSTVRFNALVTAVVALVVTAHLMLYLGFEKRGRYDLQLSGLFFPALEDQGFQIPGYTFQHLRAMQDTLASRGICSGEVVGLDSLVMGDAANRTMAPHCLEPTRANAGTRTLYFVAAEQDALQFEFTRALEPVAIVGASAIYAVQDSGALVNGMAANNVVSDKKMNYMTFLPARLEKGLNIALPPAEKTILRVALRCGKDYPIAHSAAWNVSGAVTTEPLRGAHHRYLGSNYYDLEWTLTMPPGQTQGATVHSALGPLDCDVSAIARPDRGR